MRYGLATFRVRTETMRFFGAMKRRGMPVAVVNTPKEAHVGCGVSVRFPIEGWNVARSILRYGGYDSFAGFFELFRYGAKTVVKML